MPKQRLLDIIKEIAGGHYSDDIMALTSPDTPEPMRTIAEAMGMMMVKVEAREYQLELMIEELKELNQKIKDNTIATVSTMASALAARDTYTEGHAERVSEYSCQIATVMQLDSQEIEHIRLGSLLHDIGKISFPDALFAPHGQKNPPEIIRKIVKHPEIGAEILSNLDFLGPAIEYVKCHHERPDGGGYPQKLKGKEIPLGARIIAVADAFDAMTTDRPYQKGKSEQEALEILKNGAGKFWDADSVHAFTKVVEEKEATLNRFANEPSSYDLLDPQELFTILNLQKGSTVANLACGRGTYAKALANHVGEKGKVFAVDLWQNGLALLDRQLEKQEVDVGNIVTLRSDVGRHIPIEDKQIDLCLMTTHIHSLQQCNCINRAMRECARILRKKGTFAIIEYQEKKEQNDTAEIDTKEVVCTEQLIKDVTAEGFTWIQTKNLGQDLLICIFKKGTK